MDDEPVSEALDVQLRRLADLHADGQLDAEEFRTAKARVLAAPTGTLPAPAPTAAHRTQLTRRGASAIVIVVAVVLGFMVAMVAAAVTGLQRPAAWAVCRDGRFVAGQTVEHSLQATGYNFAAECVAADGTARSVSSLALAGVLWLEYAVVALALIALVVALVRSVRGSRRDRAQPAGRPA